MEEPPAGHQAPPEAASRASGASRPTNRHPSSGGRKGEAASRQETPERDETKPSASEHRRLSGTTDFSSRHTPRSAPHEQSRGARHCGFVRLSWGGRSSVTGGVPKRDAQLSGGLMAAPAPLLAMAWATVLRPLSINEVGKTVKVPHTLRVDLPAAQPSKQVPDDNDWVE